MSEWKSIGLEAPPKGRDVIVHGTDCGEEFVVSGVFDSSGEFQSDGDYVENRAICHWMEIPTPPAAILLLYTLDGCNVPYPEIDGFKVETEPSDDFTYKTTMLVVDRDGNKRTIMTGAGDVYGAMLFLTKTISEYVRENIAVSPWCIRDTLENFDDREYRLEDDWNLTVMEANR